MPYSQQNVTALLVEMRKTYIGNLPDKIDDLEAHLLMLGEADDYTGAFESSYRIAHNIKGSAGTYDINILSTICHHLEDRLTVMSEQHCNHDRRVIRMLLDHVDLMRDVVTQLNDSTDDVSTIEGKLEDLRKHSAVTTYRGLIADTSTLHIEITKDIFKNYPIEFTVVNDGQVALQRVLHEPFDLLISSAELPMLNGRALIAALRLSNSRYRRQRSILLTSKCLPHPVRDTDPDFILLKDSKLMANFSTVARQAMELLAKA
jgi:CheY-like chemotaxis protein